jgi:cbb3-type cytochrome oxidase subunit 1
MKEISKIERYFYIAIIFLFIGMIIGMYFEHKIFEPKLNYEPLILTKKITLHNSNTFESIKLVSINCSDGVDYTNHGNAYYASTWNNNKTKDGTCEITYLDNKVSLD